MKPITLQMLAKWLDKQLTDRLRRDAVKDGFNLTEDTLYFAATIVVVDWAAKSGLFPREVIEEEDIREM